LNPIVASIVCWFLKHPLWYPTNFQTGWHCKRQKRFINYQIPQCRRCGLPIGRPTLPTAYFMPDELRESLRDVVCRIVPARAFLLGNVASLLVLFRVIGGVP